VSFDRAYTELRPALFALAYRITGNRADAEEIVQDTFVRLHDAGAKDTVRSLKAYLATITARLSFNRLRDRRARRESYVGEWLPEPLSRRTIRACAPRTSRSRSSSCWSASRRPNGSYSSCAMHSNFHSRRSRRSSDETS
jgi:RNA polymerase sigma-70 factor (ECF subfamily)